MPKEIKVSPNGKESQTGSQIGGSIVGVLLGTGLLIYAQSISPPDSLSKLLIILAPALAVVGDKVSAFILSSIKATYKKHVTSKAREQIAGFLKNPDTSDAHKDNLRRKMEELEVQSISFIDEQLLNPVLQDRVASGNSRKRVSRKQSTRSQ